MCDSEWWLDALQASADDNLVSVWSDVVHRRRAQRQVQLVSGQPHAAYFQPDARRRRTVPVQCQQCLGLPHLLHHPPRLQYWQQQNIYYQQHSQTILTIPSRWNHVAFLGGQRDHGSIICLAPRYPTFYTLKCRVKLIYSPIFSHYRKILRVKSCNQTALQAHWRCWLGDRSGESGL